MQWDVFCRVVDNHGDLGVCWRLAADLGARGEQVRLWVDDPRALAWMAPAGAPGVAVVPWQAPLPDVTPGDVVVEAFGCNPPDAFVKRMAQRRPVWINLEYLSAEPYVERSHGLPSPRPEGMKWFFYPGFTPATGGLLREPAGLEPDGAGAELAVVDDGFGDCDLRTLHGSSFSLVLKAGVHRRCARACPTGEGAANGIRLSREEAALTV